MMKAEFEAILTEKIGLGKDYYLTAGEWAVIEDVYMWYPTDNEVTKGMYADMLIQFGFRVFNDLHNRAKTVMELSQQADELESQAKAAREKKNSL